MTRFSHINGSVDIKLDPTYPGTIENNKKQLRGYDSTGTPYTYTKSVNSFYTHILNFTKLSCEESLELTVFFDIVTDGFNELFTWTDGQGVNRVVRFAMDTMEPIQKGNYWTVVIKLEEEL